MDPYPDIFYFIAGVNLAICALGFLMAFSLGIYVMREKTKMARLLGCVAFSEAMVIASIGNVALGTILHYTHFQWAVHLVAQGGLVVFCTYALARFYWHFVRGS